MPAIWTKESLRSLPLLKLEAQARWGRQVLQDANSEGYLRSLAMRAIEEWERRKQERSIPEPPKPRAKPAPATQPAVFSGAEISDSEISRVMAEMGRRGGKIGGKARAASLTPEQRSQAAWKAARARWDAPANARKKQRGTKSGSVMPSNEGTGPHRGSQKP